MAMTASKNLKPAKRYAKALLELSHSELPADKIYQDIKFSADTIMQNAELQSFLANPVVSKEDKKDVLQKIFNGKIDAAVLNFLFLLNENSRLEILDDICLSFKELLDEEKNILNVFVTSAIELNEGQKSALKTKLENKFNKAINPEYAINADILGGLILKINDTVIDLSIKKRIENLAKM